MNPELSREELANIKQFLEDEQKKLTRELGGIAKKGESGEWEPVPPPISEVTSDPNDVADRFEEFDERLSTEHELAIRLKNVVAALRRMSEGKYGLCEVDGKPISLERLRANPSATTCVLHAD